MSDHTTEELGRDLSQGAAAGGAPKKRSRRWMVEWAIIVIVALGAALVLRAFVVETFYVPSTSMYPTLKAGDRIVVEKVSTSVQRGDIIVFRRPAAEDCGGPPVPDLVKRVIGLPGETISAHDGKVFVTDHLLRQPWLPPGRRTYTATFGPTKIPADNYFVMGDNRVDSCDSRMWGTVNQSLVVGKVFMILWPPSRLRFF